MINIEDPYELTFTICILGRERSKCYLWSGLGSEEKILHFTFYDFSKMFEPFWF